MAILSKQKVVLFMELNKHALNPAWLPTARYARRCAAMQPMAEIIKYTKRDKHTGLRK